MDTVQLIFEVVHDYGKTVLTVFFDFSDVNIVSRTSRNGWSAEAHFSTRARL